MYATLSLVTASLAALPSLAVNDVAVFGNWTWAEPSAGRGRSWDVLLDGIEGDILLYPTEGGVLVAGESLSFVSESGQLVYTGTGSLFGEQKRFDLGFRCVPKSVAVVAGRVFVHHLINVGEELSSIAQYDAATGELMQRREENLLPFRADDRLLPLHDGVMFASRNSLDAQPLRFWAAGEPMPTSLPPRRVEQLSGSLISFGRNVLRVEPDGAVTRFPFDNSVLGVPSSAHVLPSGRVLARYFFPIDPDRLPRSPPGTSALSLYEGEVEGFRMPLHRWTFQSRRLEFGMSVDSAERFFGVAAGALWAQTPQGVLAFDEAGAMKAQIRGARGIACAPDGLYAIAEGSLRVYTVGSFERRASNIPDDLSLVALGRHGVYFARRTESTKGLTLSFRPYESSERRESGEHEGVMAHRATVMARWCR